METTASPSREANEHDVKLWIKLASMNVYTFVYKLPIDTELQHISGSEG